MSYEEIAVRAWAEPAGSALSFERSGRVFRLPEYALVIDTETSTDITQALNFGSYRFIALNDGENPPGSCLEEGLFYADELAARYPDGLGTLESYVGAHEADLDVERYRRPLHLYTRREFVRQVFLRAAYRTRALVVGFNLPFDLSRLAVDVSAARRSYAGGFSLALWDYEKNGERVPDPNRPRVVVKSLNSKEHLFRFTARRAGDPEDYEEREQADGKTRRVAFSGHFLDLHTLTFALTAENFSLEKACKAFGVEHGKQKVKRHGLITPRYVDYNRRDVKATGELLMKALEEFDRHPIRLQATKAFSPASIAKSYEDAMGLAPILGRQPDFDRSVLGYAMNAFYGGRAECRIRRVALPVCYTDFASMYPTVNALMGNWRLLTTAEISVVPATDEVKRLLDEVTLDACFEPATWQRLRAFVKVRPDGEIFPVRVRYDSRGPSWQIGANPLTGDEGQWFALPDVVAAKVASGKTPQVLDAIRLEASAARQPGLRRTKLRGAVPVNPRRQDFFRAVVEERRRTRRNNALDEAERERLEAALKVIANAGSYGIFAEMNRKQQSAKVPVVFWNAEGERCETKLKTPEEPGPFCFPPLAALITSAARLMLTLLECSVRERGGSYVFCDTDSLAIVASERGGLLACPGGPHHLPDGSDAVKALSWPEVDEVVARFANLNPYDPDAVPGSVLDIEKQNYVKNTKQRRELWCYAISAKRYVLYNLGGDGRPVIRKHSRHGLGHLLDPTNPDSGDDSWIEQVWQHILALDVLGQRPVEPAWFGRPAMARVSVSDMRTLRLFEALSKGKPYAERVKPQNFLLSVQVADLGHPPGVDPTKPFHLVAPYHSDPRQWLKLAFTDRYSKKGATYHITTDDDVAEGVACVKTYGEVVEDYRWRPEHKSLAPDGQPCGGESTGLLRRRPVEVVRPVYVGKEANSLEEVEHLLIEDEDEIMNRYEDAAHDPFVRYVVPVLRGMPREQVLRVARLHPDSVKRILAGRVPHGKTASV